MTPAKEHVTLPSVLPPAAGRRWTAGVVREVLPNGLTVLVQRLSTAPVVGVVTYVRAGFFDEPDHWVGISHVLEHMYFKGTPTRGVGEIARETKAAGGYLNAGTSYDYTMYYVVLPAGGLVPAVDIQADALRHCLIDPDELSRELQVIIQEAKRKLDTPGAVTAETVHEVLFDRHRIRRWRIGREADLARFTRDDVWDYYASRYAPERTIVAVVGDVDPGEAVALVRKKYADWSAGNGAIGPSPVEPPREGERARTLRGDVMQAHLGLGWRGVEPLHPDAPALELGAAVLGAGRGGWLYGALRDTGLATSATAYHHAPTEVGVFHVHAEFDAARLADVVAAALGCVSRLAHHGLPADDLERARTLVLTRWARHLESVDGRAAALASAEALRDIDLLEEEYERLRTIDAEAVREAVGRHLRPEAVAGVAYLPDGVGEDLTVELLRTAAQAVPTPPRVVRRAPVTPPPPLRRSGRLQSGVLHVPLSGADLLLLPKPGAPVASLGVHVARAGAEAPEQAGIGALAMRSLLRGAAGMDATELAFAAERLGGSLGLTLAHDWVGLGLGLLPERLGEAAALLWRVLLAPAHEPEHVVTERALLIEEARQVADDSFRYPFQLAFAAAFGDRGYGRPVSGLAETLADLDQAAVRGWYGDTVLAGRWTVVAVGDIEAEPLADMLAGVFDGLPGVAPRSRGPRDPWIPDAAAERSERREKAQTALAMLFPGPSRGDPMRHAADVWAAIASGLGGRLFEALRERRSLAYTVMGTAWQRGRAGALATYIATSPEREQEARAAMLEELHAFVDAPPAAEELARATQYLAGQTEVHRQTAASVASEIAEAWLVGGGLAELEETVEAYRSVTAEAVWEVARRSLDPARRAEGVVRGSGGGR